MSKFVTGPHIQGGGGGKKKKGKKKGYSGQPSVGPFAGVEPWVYFNVGGDQTKRMLEEIRVAIEYVIGEHVGGARSSERETRLINKVAQALVGEEELANPTKPGGGHDRTHHQHGTMQAYNVDADDDYEFHRHGSASAEYRGSGSGAYRGYGDSGKDASSSSRGYGSSAAGPYGSHSSHGRGGLPSSSTYGGGGGGAGGGHGANGAGYMAHGGGGGGSSHYSRSVHSSVAAADKPPQVGDARYAAAQAAVAAALGHATISGSSAMPASVHAGSSGYGNYSSPYGGGGGGNGGGGIQPRQLGPGGGPARYNPSNGDGSAAGIGGGGGGAGGGMGSSGYHGGSGRADSGGGSQPRSLARPGGGATHEYVSSRGGGGSRPSSGQSPVSTVLGGTYHNFAVPPNSLPLGGSSGGSGGEVQQHYMPRSAPMTRSEDSRDGHGGRGGKRGRW
ncbi:unnamed protein product [Laminaria digitata]